MRLVYRVTGEITLTKFNTRACALLGVANGERGEKVMKFLSVCKKKSGERFCMNVYIKNMT